jgi:transposase
MNKITRRKPRNDKGRHPKPNKTSRRELTTVERAFVAGACIAGSLSHRDCAQLFLGATSKSTITRAVQRVNERAIELNTTIINPRCFEFASNKGPPRLLNDEQRAQVVAITIASQQSREKES